jgi:hypothetical protein
VYFNVDSIVPIRINIIYNYNGQLISNVGGRCVFIYIELINPAMQMFAFRGQNLSNSLCGKAINIFFHCDSIFENGELKPFVLRQWQVISHDDE